MPAVLHTSTLTIPCTILAGVRDPRTRQTWLLLTLTAPVPHEHYGHVRRGWFDSRYVAVERVTVDANKITPTPNP